MKTNEELIREAQEALHDPDIPSGGDFWADRGRAMVLALSNALEAATKPAERPICEDHLLKHGAEAEALRRGIEDVIATDGKRRLRLMKLLERVDAGESLAWLEEREARRHEDQDDVERNPLAADATANDECPFGGEENATELEESVRRDEAEALVDLHQQDPAALVLALIKERDAAMAERDRLAAQLLQDGPLAAAVRAYQQIYDARPSKLFRDEKPGECHAVRMPDSFWASGAGEAIKRCSDALDRMLALAREQAKP